MSLISLIALFSGILGVWLTIRQNIWCWPMALISVVTSGIDFYYNRLFGDMALQVIYFLQGLYGWLVWHVKKNEAFEAVHMPIKHWLLAASAIIILWPILYYILLVVKGNRALLDALLTAASLVTTYLMTKKWIENWLLWVLIDATYIILYVVSGLWSYALLYLVFTGMAAYGWIQWKEIASKK